MPHDGTGCLILPRHRAQVPRGTSSGNRRAGVTLAGSVELPRDLSATLRVAHGLSCMIGCCFNPNTLGK